MNSTEAYLERFERIAAGNAEPGWLSPVRRAGITRFAALGFPTVQDEDWRFTSVASIARMPFRPALEPTPDSVSAAQVATLTFGTLPAIRLVFVNGHFDAELSSPSASIPGVTVRNLGAALKTDAGVLEANLGRYAESERQAFTALNNAFFKDGAFVRLDKGVVLDKPIHLLYLSTGSEPGACIQPRNLILAGAGSQATVLESYVSLANTACFTNTVTELVLEDGAVLEHVKFQDESLSAHHIAAIHAQLGRGANFAAHSIATGAQLSRNNIRMVLNGEGVEGILNGLYITRGSQLADHHMVVEHAQPHCNSHEYYNGILDGRSKGVFHGRILVRKGAQKTDAKQTNKNLLLSDEATADTKPQLEIYADDVKCTHGATVGQLNDESVFYLRARGIGAETARRMLIHAFAGEIIERVRHPAVREELDKLVWDRLEANPHVAEPKDGAAVG